MNDSKFHTNSGDLDWLSKAIESNEAVNESRPILVRSGEAYDETDVKGPQWHPYFEVNIVVKGKGTAYVENETIPRSDGEVLLLGPGIPHWGKVEKFPFECITIYFLPVILIEVGSECDGIRILQRFNARQLGHERVVYPPDSVLKKIIRLGREMIDEFGANRFGREAKLRILLIDLLITLMRWEESSGKLIMKPDLDYDWRPILKALQFLREHSSEQIYTSDICRSSGVSESTLKATFHKVLGLSWVKYLQCIRINRAIALLNDPGHNITSAAFAVGFDSLSHFNKTFKDFMGVSPKNYRGRVIASQKSSKSKR